MSPPTVSRADLMDVRVPKSVWSRSSRPLQGRLTRILFGATLLLAGLAVPWPAVGLALAVAGALGYLLLPAVTDRLIERREPKIIAAGRDDAASRIAELEKSVLVSAFAPDAWVTLQRGRLHLALGDGRSAAQAFADTARIVGEPDMPELRSAQAGALIVAEDRVAAREHLVALDQAAALSHRDRLYLGVVMLDGSARNDQARAHLEAAFESLDGHPQAAAALALALARARQPEGVERAMELAEQAEAAEADPVAQRLIKRARKALRPAREAAKKKHKRKG